MSVQNPVPVLPSSKPCQGAMRSCRQTELHYNDNPQERARTQLSRGYVRNSPHQRWKSTWKATYCFWSLAPLGNGYV